MSLDGKVALVTGSSQGIGQTIAVSDFYWGKKDFPYPMGFIQNTGNVLPDMIPAEGLPLLASLLKFVPKVDLDLKPQY